MMLHTLDGVGPFDNRPSADLTLFKKKKKKRKSKIQKINIKKIHIYIQHMRCYMRQMTCDTWWELNILAKCQVPSSKGLGVKVF